MSLTVFSASDGLQPLSNKSPSRYNVCEPIFVLCFSPLFLVTAVFSVSGLAKKVTGHQGLQLQKVVGPDEKL